MAKKPKNGYAIDKGFANKTVISAILNPLQKMTGYDLKDAFNDLDAKLKRIIEELLHSQFCMYYKHSLELHMDDAGKTEINPCTIDKDTAARFFLEKIVYPEAAKNFQDAVILLFFTALFLKDGLDVLSKELLAKAGKAKNNTKVLELLQIAPFIFSAPCFIHLLYRFDKETALNQVKAWPLYGEPKRFDEALDLFYENDVEPEACSWFLEYIKNCELLNSGKHLAPGKRRKKYYKIVERYYTRSEVREEEAVSLLYDFFIREDTCGGFDTLVNSVAVIQKEDSTLFLCSIAKYAVKKCKKFPWPIQSIRPILEICDDDLTEGFFTYVLSDSHDEALVRFAITSLFKSNRYTVLKSIIKTGTISYLAMSQMIAYFLRLKEEKDSDNSSNNKVNPRELTHLVNALIKRANAITDIATKTSHLYIQAQYGNQALCLQVLEQFENLEYNQRTIEEFLYSILLIKARWVELAERADVLLKDMLDDELSLNDSPKDSCILPILQSCVKKTKSINSHKLYEAAITFLSCSNGSLTTLSECLADNTVSLESKLCCANTLTDLAKNGNLLATDILCETDFLSLSWHIPNLISSIYQRTDSAVNKHNIKIFTLKRLERAISNNCYSDQSINATNEIKLVKTVFPDYSPAEVRELGRILVTITSASYTPSLPKILGEIQPSFKNNYNGLFEKILKDIIRECQKIQNNTQKTSDIIGTATKLLAPYMMN